MDVTGKLEWPPNHALHALSIEGLGNLHPINILWYYDYPLIFTTKTTKGSLLLAYIIDEYVDEDGPYTRFLITFTNEGFIERLEAGKMTIFEVLNYGPHWVVDYDDRSLPKRAFAVTRDQIPGDAWPPVDLKI